MRATSPAVGILEAVRRGAPGCAGHSFARSDKKFGGEVELRHRQTLSQVIAFLFRRVATCFRCGWRRVIALALGRDSLVLLH